jgi:hypothetical protein
MLDKIEIAAKMAEIAHILYLSVHQTMRKNLLWMIFYLENVHLKNLRLSFLLKNWQNFA